MSRMMEDYNRYIADIDIENEQPANFTKVQADFHTQLNNLEDTIKPYNDNTFVIWEKLTKFEPKAKFLFQELLETRNDLVPSVRHHELHDGRL